MAHNDLIRAAEKNNVALVKRLIEGGADVDGVDWGGCSALHCAVLNGFVVECAKVLLEANADVNKADRDGYTPLHFASIWEGVENATLLIEWKANVNAKTRYGISPLHFAAQGGHLACIEMLVQAGAELDACNEDGEVPLARAILSDKRDAAELLLDHGAKMSNLPPDFRISDWLKGIVAKRENVKRGLLAFIGVLRRRFVVGGGGTEIIGGRLPRDVVGMLSRWVWTTRFDARWTAAALKMTQELKSSRCNMQ